jgi:hypothetical protein
MFTSKFMRDKMRDSVKGMTISQLCRVMKISGINSDSLTVSQIAEVVTSDEYLETLMKVIHAGDDEKSGISFFSLEVVDDIYVDIFCDYNAERLDDNVIRLIMQIAESGYLKPLQTICDDFNIAISVW